MGFNPQPQLQFSNILLSPLLSSHYSELFNAASDPLIWEQHPENTRYQEPVFQQFFDKAIQSCGALVIRDTNDNSIIGTSRYYDIDDNSSTVAIGYTFITRRHWGTGTNSIVKRLMLEHAFKDFKTVLFHVGENNFRSQKAVEKLGAKLVQVKKVENGRTSLEYALDSRTYSGRTNL